MVVLGMGCDRLLGLTPAEVQSLVRLLVALEVVVVVAGLIALWSRLRPAERVMTLIGLLVRAAAVVVVSGVGFFVVGAACDCGRGNCL
ncbi:MAG: hypothetical protein ACOYOQ_14925 [Microthrixaceae bacterium]